MNMCSKWTKVLMAGLASALCAVSSASAAEVVLKAITYAPPSKFEDSMVIFKKWMERVNTAGKGEIRVELLGGPEVFPVSDQMNALSKGLVDAVMTFSVHTPIVPEVDTTGLSDITPTEERANGYLALLDKAHEKMNVKVIGRTATHSGFYIFSKQPIRKLDDFKGVKIRSHSGYDPLFKTRRSYANRHEHLRNIRRSGARSGARRRRIRSSSMTWGWRRSRSTSLADAFWPSHTTFIYHQSAQVQRLDPEAAADSDRCADRKREGHGGGQCRS